MELLGHQLVGSGEEKVLFLHNWMSDSTSYDPLLPYLDLERFTCLFVDLRGYGRSKELRGTYSVEEASSDAIKLANALAWDQFHIVGHSMSGMIAQRIAVDHVARIKSIVAVTPAPPCGTPAPQEVMDFLEEAASMNDHYASEGVQRLTGYRYCPYFAQKMVSYWRKCSTAEARVGYLHLFANTDFSHLVQGLTTSMLVIFGEHDFTGTEELMRKTFLKWYPNARLECCEGAGHFPPQETPVYLASAIEKFICLK
ncbi:MAG: alpha/beta hydrolase [Verrucomicrobia bacterium]|nr:alpha/beta hydrolase [Verrucomicrobiota bacterium]